VNAEGEVLTEKTAVIEAVDARVRLKRRLPARCDREAVDKLAVRQGLSQRLGSSAPFGDPAPLEGFLGGIRIKIDCQLWDHGGPHDCDTILIAAVVPADPKYHAPLLAAARKDLEPYQHPRDLLYQTPIHSLVNYPGEATEACLKEVFAKQDWSDVRRFAARNVLLYLRYRHDITDPLNKRLVGKWQLVGSSELIDLDFHGDNSFTATAFKRPTDGDNPSQASWRGKGYWVVRAGRLSVFRTHSWSGSWPKGRWVERERTIFGRKLIEEVTAEGVVLEGGPPMKRR
jgi:hypothetical protein